MFSSMFNIRPNPRYVPGGTENFWLTAANNDPPSKKNDAGLGETALAKESVKMQETVPRMKTQGDLVKMIGNNMFNNVFYQNM